MTPIETVRIKDDSAEGGFVVINKSDLLPEHVLYEEPKAATAAGEGKPVDEAKPTTEKKPSVKGAG